MIIKIQLQIKTDPNFEFGLMLNDNRIIMAAFLLHEKGEKVVFVSKDFAARLKAEAIGLETQDYENLKYSYSAIYKGLRKVESSKHAIQSFFIKMDRFP